MRGETGNKGGRNNLHHIEGEEGEERTRPEKGRRK